MVVSESNGAFMLDFPNAANDSCPAAELFRNTSFERRPVMSADPTGFGRKSGPSGPSIADPSLAGPPLLPAQSSGEGLSGEFTSLSNYLRAQRFRTVRHPVMDGLHRDRSMVTLVSCSAPNTGIDGPVSDVCHGRPVRFTPCSAFVGYVGL